MTEPTVNAPTATELPRAESAAANAGTGKSGSNNGRPTLRDVAGRAGLSVTQTSRALNGHSDVAEDSRRRALAAADELGYVPNLAARRLKDPGSGTQTIGVLLTSTTQRFSDPFLGDLLTAMVDEVSRHGFEMLLFSPTVDEDPVAALERSVRHKRADGYVLLRLQTKDPRVAFLSSAGVPFVTLGRPVVDGPYRRVVGAEDSLDSAVGHLVELGHRRIGAIALPAGYAISDRRLVHFTDALTRHGLPVDPSLITTAESFQEDGGRSAMEALLAAEPPPTAVIGFNDQLAIGALAALLGHGLRVPDDISIVGFDDVSLARFISPTLTTLHQPVERLGQLLIQQLVAAIDDPDSDHEVVVKPELMVRESTGAVASVTH